MYLDHSCVFHLGKHGSLLWVFWLYNPCLLKLWFAGLALCIGHGCRGKWHRHFFISVGVFFFCVAIFFLHLPSGKNFQLRRISPTRKPSAEISAEGRSRYSTQNPAKRFCIRTRSKRRVQQLPHAERTINQSAAHIFMTIYCTLPCWWTPLDKLLSNLLCKICKLHHFTA